MYKLHQLALDYTLGLIHLTKLELEVNYFNMGSDMHTATIVHTHGQTIVKFD